MHSADEVGTVCKRGIRFLPDCADGVVNTYYFLSVYLESCYCLHLCNLSPVIKLLPILNYPKIVCKCNNNKNLP